MKNIRFLMVIGLLGMAVTTSAHVISTNSFWSDTEGTWSGLRASYLPISFKGDGGVDVDITGFQLGYVKSFAVSTKTPLYIETSINVSYMECYAMDIYSINFPANFGYKYAFNDIVNIFPYVGLIFRGNLFGNYEGAGDKISIFDDRLEDFGIKAKRFQLGWQVGATASFYQFVVGVSYGTDFIDFIEGGKFNTPAISIGYNF